MANVLTAQESGFEESLSIGRWDTFFGWDLAVWDGGGGHSGDGLLIATCPNVNTLNTDIRVVLIPGKPTSLDLWVGSGASVACRGYVHMWYFDSVEGIGDEYFQLQNWTYNSWTNYSAVCTPPAGTTRFSMNVISGITSGQDSWAAGDALFYDDMVIEGAVTPGSARRSLRKRQMDR